VRQAFGAAVDWLRIAELAVDEPGSGRDGRWLPPGIPDPLGGPTCCLASRPFGGFALNLAQARMYPRGAIGFREDHVS
jgi:hypothetical protein